MNRETAIKWLEKLESALVRAEEARKDIDLILVMRALREILEEEVRSGGNEHNH